MKKIGIFIFMIMAILNSYAQVEVSTEAQVTTSSGDHTPLWLNANKYGLSSLELTNGYVRAGAFMPQNNDSSRQWHWGAGIDLALATGFTSTLVVQQAYAELGWGNGLLTVGSKEQPMMLRNQELSTGAQTLGINARPVPSVRLGLPDYWNIPGLGGWLGLKGHLAFGLQTDDAWQREFTGQQNRYTKHSRIHTKAGYLRIGKEEHPFNVEMGLEMGAQYGGTSYIPMTGVTGLGELENANGLKGMWHALFPSGHEAKEDDIIYKNAEGNHMGSWLLRANLDYDDWGVSVSADHYFEDHSSMFFLDYNGYGTGEEWDERKDSRYFVYDLKDILLGTEIRLKRIPWMSNIVVEYIYTKYQSGPVYHDHTMHMPDHVSGIDNYYNHDVFTGWQHWGQVIGNPLYRSPIYNDDGTITVKDNRFFAWHLAMSGSVTSQLSYRLMGTWQRGFGTYATPLLNPEENTSVLAEATYTFPQRTRMEGWSIKGAFGLDHGELLGNNVGFQLTVRKQLAVKIKRS